MIIPLYLLLNSHFLAIGTQEIVLSIFLLIYKLWILDTEFQEFQTCPKLDVLPTITMSLYPYFFPCGGIADMNSYPQFLRLERFYLVPHVYKANPSQLANISTPLIYFHLFFIFWQIPKLIFSFSAYYFSFNINVYIFSEKLTFFYKYYIFN